MQSIKELDRLLDTGSFKIKQWISSTEIVLNELLQVSSKKPDEEKSVESTAVPTAVHLDGEKGVKTLGVGWNPQTDVLSFAVKEPNVAKLTKRVVLTNISRSLGLASALTIKARIALQDIWRAKNFDWDDPLPIDTRVRWETLFKEIQGLRTLEFPRCLQPENVSGDSELYLFADASGATLWSCGLSSVANSKRTRSTSGCSKSESYTTATDDYPTTRADGFPRDFPTCPNHL